MRKYFKWEYFKVFGSLVIIVLGIPFLVGCFLFLLMNPLIWIIAIIEIILYVSKWIKDGGFENLTDWFNEEKPKIKLQFNKTLHKVRNSFEKIPQKRG